MADVFVSYKAEDRQRVRPIVAALERDGFSVWWDAHLGAGQDWRDRIACELNAARCVVVAWTSASTGPAGRFVRDEAERAMRRDVYVPVRLDLVDPPLGFGEMQAISMVGWSGRRSARSYRALREAINSVLRGDSFRNANGDAVARYPRRRLILSGAATAVALAAGGGWVWSRRNYLPTEAQRLLEDARQGVQDGGVEANGNAIGKLKRASELAPGSAEVWGLLALAYTQQSRMAATNDRDNLLRRGLAASKRAIALEPNQPEAISAQIFAMPLFGNWYAIEQAARSALNNTPGNPFLLLRLCEVLFQVGRHDECLTALAEVLRDLSTPLTHVGRVELLWNLGRLDEAESELQRAFDLWPRHFAVWFTRFYYLAYNGRAPEALALIDDSSSRPIGIPDWNFQLVRAQANAIVAREPSAFRTTLKAMEEAGHRAAGFAENAAIFAAFARMIDDAFAILYGLYLNRGFNVGESWFSAEQGVYIGRERSTYILFQQQMTALRRDSRFDQLTREIGLAEYWKRTGSRPKVIA